MNNYTIPEIQANMDSLKTSVKKFDKKADFTNEFFCKTNKAGFDLIISVEYMSSFNRIETMSRYLTK